MSLRFFASATGLAIASVTLGACHLLLDGQELGDGTGASGLGGTPSQGGGGGTTTASTTDAATSTSTGMGGGEYNDRCGAPEEAGEPCASEMGPCEVPDGVSRFHFNALCADVPDGWCAHYPTLANGNLDLSQGNLRADAEGQTGFWYEGPGGSTLEFPPFLYRTVSGDADFVVITRLRDIYTGQGNGGTYNVAGLAVRSAASTSWTPGDMDEIWVKLEYGNRGAMGENYPGLGVLLGQGSAGSAQQLDGDPPAMMPGDAVFEEHIDLAICRIGDEFTFAINRNDTDPMWSYLNAGGTPAFPPASDIQIGVMAGAFNDMEVAQARFEWLLYASGSSLSMQTCEQAIAMVHNGEACTQ
jgi:hypothetical protein